MATYMVLMSYTEEGIRNIKERPQRGERLRKRCQDNGGKLQAAYLAMGRYDGVLLIEAPDDQAMTRILLGIGMTGVARTETLRLFDEAEANAIVAAL